MKKLKRRQFIKTVGKGAAALGISMAVPRTAFAAWGDFAGPSVVWPSGLPNTKVLEIFLYGGLSPWETFYVRPPLTWRNFQPEISGLSWSCSGPPSSATETRSFHNDALGQAVHLGPMTKPLWRNDIVNRMRLVVLQHDLLPHEAAIPYALTGLRLGRPQLAGLGAPIQRRFMETTPRALPYSYVCIPRVFSFPGDNLQATTAIGVHPGTSRPLALRIGAGTDSLVTLLERSNVDAGSDAVLNHYRARYRDQLRHLGTGSPARSKGFAAYDSSAESLLSASALRTLLTTAPLTLRTDVACAHPGSPPMPNPPIDNIPGTAIRTAAFLLTRPGADAARYVCVVDGGLREASGGGGYDTHNTGHVTDTAVNLWNTLSALADVIQDPTQPIDPNKINLNDTMIVLTTEFGRTPARIGNGRDHWPNGYVNVLIGGPITSSGIAGAIRDASGIADASNVFSATDIRAAVLLSVPIDPFADGNFGVGDVSASLRVTGVGGEDQTSARIRRQILGIT